MVATTGFLDYLTADTDVRLAIDRRADQHRQTLAELRAQSMAMRDLVQLGVEQVKGIATVAKEVAGVRGEVAGVREDLRSMGALFDWRLGQVQQDIQFQTARLEDLTKIISKPLATQAYELWDRAQRAALNGWYDEAVKDYTATLEKEPYLAPAHLQLGFIQEYQHHDFAAAAKSFALAGRYAATKDPETQDNATAAEAYFHLQKIEREQGDLDAATEHILRTIELAPDLAAAWWECATLMAQQDAVEQAVKSLETAIQIDALYWHRAKDHDWGAAQLSVNKLLDKLEREVSTRTPDFYESFVDDAVKIRASIGDAGIRNNSRPYNSLFLDLSHRLASIKDGARASDYALQRAALEAMSARQQQLAGELPPLLKEFTRAQKEAASHLSREKHRGEQLNSELQEEIVHSGYVPIIAVGVLGLVVAIALAIAASLVAVIVAVILFTVLCAGMLVRRRRKLAELQAKLDTTSRRTQEMETFLTGKLTRIDTGIAALQRMLDRAGVGKSTA